MTRSTLVALGYTLLMAASAHAQDKTNAANDGDIARIKTVSLVGGASQFDLGITGTTAFAGVRGDMELNRWFLGEAALTATRAPTRYPQTMFIFPEVQLQMQLPYRIIRPYLGVGTGFSSAVNGGPSDGYKQTFAVATGFRALVPGTSATLRAELRIRKVGPETSASMADWSFGIGRRF